MAESPRWAQEAYDRLLAAQRVVMPEEREQMERERIRGTLRTRINRGLERNP